MGDVRVSIHLLEQAALLKLPPSTKLGFMAFCDSADKVTGIAIPGIEQVLTWAGVGKSQGYEIIAELVKLGLLKRVTEGRRGRRAEYRVFDQVACCALHKPFGSATPDKSATPDPKLGSATPEESDTADPNSPVRVRLGSGLGPAQTGPLPNYPATSTDVDVHDTPEPGLVGLSEQTPAEAAGKPSRKTALDPDWDPVSEPALIAWAKDKGAPSLEFVVDHTEEFLDWCRANNSRYIDWHAAWRKWLTKPIREEKRRATWNRQRPGVQSSEQRIAADLPALEELARREGGEQS